MADAAEQLEQQTGSTMADLAAAAAQRHGDRVAVRRRDGDGWAEVTFAEVGGIVDEIARGLIDLGIQPGDRVCLLAETRPEWTYASFAISSTGAIVVPIYPTNSPRECQWVAGDSEARAIVCEDAGQVEKIAKVRAELDALEHVIVIEGEADGAIALEDLRARGRDAGGEDEHERRRAAVGTDDPYTIIYTSGTTGNPKGVVLTHANASSVGGMVRELDFVDDDDVSYLYLPLAHVFALTVQIASWDVGSPIIYFGGDPKQIVAELAETKPTYFPSVPRIFEKIYTLVTSNVDPDTMRKAVEVGTKVRDAERAGDDVPGELRKAFDQFDEQLFKNVRAAFGERMRQSVTGAAPISPDILRLFYACGVMVYEGYGMTETTAVGTVNREDRFRFGTVGRAMPGVEVRTAEDGELEMRGPNIFREYWKNPDATKETFTGDGWLKTGDLAEIDDDGFVSITGRKKDIIITAGGKNLTPSTVENELKESRWISQAVMHGDKRPYPVAIITLDEEEILPWAKEQGLPDDVGELAKDDKVRELIQKVVDDANEHHARVAQIKKFVILDHDLSQETGELTPTLKVKRNVVEDKYSELLDSLYG
jgi:long-chain acyl-CoA synthetase